MMPFPTPIQDSDIEYFRAKLEATNNSELKKRLQKQIEILEQCLDIQQTAQSWE
jgi:hypothetical protein